MHFFTKCSFIGTFWKIIVNFHFFFIFCNFWKNYNSSGKNLWKWAFFSLQFPNARTRWGVNQTSLLFFWSFFERKSKGNLNVGRKVIAPFWRPLESQAKLDGKICLKKDSFIPLVQYPFYGMFLWKPWQKP